MNWLSDILNELQITKYQLSKETQISQRYLGKIVEKNIPMENVKHGQVLSILKVRDFHRAQQNQVEEKGCVEVEK